MNTATTAVAAPPAADPLPTLATAHLALAARWEEQAAAHFATMGKYSTELTGLDYERAASLERGIVSHIAAGDEPATLAAILAWQRATTPLRWLPHGRWYADPVTGEPDAAREATYHREADARRVRRGDRCGGTVLCGGACGRGV